MVLVRLYENAAPYSETRDGRTESGWEYDEYHLELAYWDGLAAEIEGNYQTFLKRAKLNEQDKSNEKLFADGEQQRADIDYIAIMTGVDL